MPAALIISQNQAYPSFKKSGHFDLVQTSVKVSLWSLHLYCLTLSNLGKNFNLACVLFVCAQGLAKNEGFLCASLLSALLPLDGTKAHGKVLGCKVGLGLGRKSIISGCWAPAPVARHL